MFGTIVAGTDTLGKGRNAVALAHELARATGARLLLVAVHDHGPTQPAALVRRLRLLRNELAPEALVLTVPGASPARGLRLVADEQGADLIVVGASERTRLRRVVAGEPGMKLLRAASCALAIAPDRAPSPHAVRRIGVWVGERPESAAAIELATSLALCTSAQVTTVAGLDDATTCLDLLVLASRDAGDVRRLLRDRGCPVVVAPRPAKQRIEVLAQRGLPQVRR
jgi:nucleotide-binding universal stress UspA family protein